MKLSTHCIIHLHACVTLIDTKRLVPKTGLRNQVTWAFSVIDHVVPIPFTLVLHGREQAYKPRVLSFKQSLQTGRWLIGYTKLQRYTTTS